MNNESIKSIFRRVMRMESVCARHPLAVVIMLPDMGYSTGWNGSESCVVDGKMMRKQ